MAGVNIAHLLVEAKNLASKLQQDDKSTDQLINSAQNVSEKISCLKEYKECLSDLHDSRSNQRPRSVLVHNLQQENRQIKILQDENRQLKSALEEHQAAIDLIMKRYRQQVTELTQLNQCEENAFRVADYLKDQNFYSDMSSLSKFARLFDQCMKFGEEASRKDQQELIRLKAENQLLRRLLKIAADHYPNTTDGKIDNSNLQVENSTIEEKKEEIESQKIEETSKNEPNSTEIPAPTTTNKGFLSKISAPIRARSAGKRVSLPCADNDTPNTSTIVRKSPSSTIASPSTTATSSSLSSTNQKRRSAAAPSFINQSSSPTTTTIRQSKSASFNKTTSNNANSRKSSSSIR